MTEESKKMTRVKTHAEVLREVKDNLNDKEINPNSKNKFLDALLVVGNEYIKVNKENEARKSPEQRAHEARLREAETQALKAVKLEKEKTKAKELFKTWLKRDTWRIYDEAIPLSKGEKPEDLLFNDEDLWKLVQRCVNQSLSIINPDAKPKLWLVKPFEWVRWLKEKDLSIHPQLAELLLPASPAHANIQTTQAIKSRERAKAERIKAIKSFVIKVSELARSQNLVWNSQAIPVTKNEFLHVFYSQNSAIKKIKKDSFDRDIAEIGIKFKRGTKSNKNNMLNVIFSIK
jgi:hypothetical protein